MVPKRIEIIKEEGGQNKNYVLRRFEEKDVHRIFMAWNNPQSYRYNAIDWKEQGVREMLSLSWPSSYGMYFMVLEDCLTNEIVATCRFGGETNDKESEWDFGYCTFRSDDKDIYTLEDIRDAFKNGVRPDNKNWGKGYGSMIVETIIKIARDEGVQKLISGADGVNWGSQKVMMKNGMTFYEMDGDGDVDFIINLRGKNGELLPLKKPTREELIPIWDKHMDSVNGLRSDPKIKARIEELDNEQLGKSLMFLLLNRASRIEELINNKNSDLENLKLVQQDIRNIYSLLTYEEKVLFEMAFIDYRLRWQSRVNNKNFDSNEVTFNLNCCKLVEKEINKISVSQS